MTEIGQSRHFPLDRRSGSLRILAALLPRGFGALARKIRRRQAVRALRNLEDHELRDIGLARSQIEAAVRGCVTAPDPTRMP